MQRETYVIIFTFFLFTISYSQEKTISHQGYIDPFIINPACTGSEMFPIIRFSVEKQWVGFTDSPSTLLLTANSRLGSYDFYTPKGLVNKTVLKIGDRVGLGGGIYYDNNGPLNSIGGMLSYAYHVPVNQLSRLSMGISVNLVNKSINPSEMKPDELDDTYLFNEQNDMFRMNFTVGLFYYTKELFAGLSVNEIFPLVTHDIYKEKKMPGYFFLAGYKFHEVTRLLDFEPSVIVTRASDEDVYFDVFARIYYLKYHWASISYSTGGRADIMLAVKFYNSLYLGYNYIYTLGRITRYNYGSHRISLGINLGLRRMGLDKL